MAMAESSAFRAAALRSEMVRAWVVIGIAAAILLLVAMPGLTHEVSSGIRWISMSGLTLLIAMQAIALAYVHRATRLGIGLPRWVLVGGVLLEAGVPSMMIASNIRVGSLSPFSALSAPPILAYGVMVCLTTLRLRPWLCVLGAFVSSLSYASVLAWVVFGLGETVPTTGLPMAAYVNSCIILLLGGLGAAWVAKEMRRHLEAALSEAETRNQLERMERDLDVARTIQRALLPRGAPDVPGYDIAGWNRSADQTGGDYYDWQELPDGNWMVTLADVSGHGIGPALVTAACRAYARASSFYDADLSKLAGRMNRLLAADLPEGRFVTMVSVLMDRRGGPMRLLSAGHGPIVLYVGATGKVEDILPQGLPLAVMADAEFGPHREVELREGDVLALVTDGIVEWSRPSEGGKGEQFGIERLRDALRRHAHLPAAEVIEAVAKEVGTFAGGAPQQDDLTMVVVKRK
jgi:serine phosphatase RsbU (regulator of sigma subunit)